MSTPLTKMRAKRDALKLMVSALDPVVKGLRTFPADYGEDSERILAIVQDTQNSFFRRIQILEKSPRFGRM